MLLDSGQNLRPKVDILYDALYWEEWEWNVSWVCIGNINLVSQIEAVYGSHFKVFGWYRLPLLYSRLGYLLSDFNVLYELSTLTGVSCHLCLTLDILTLDIQEIASGLKWKCWLTRHSYLPYHVRQWRVTNTVCHLLATHNTLSSDCFSLSLYEVRDTVLNWWYLRGRLGAW